MPSLDHIYHFVRIHPDSPSGEPRYVEEDSGGLKDYGSYTAAQAFVDTHNTIHGEDPYQDVWVEAFQLVELKAGQALSRQKTPERG